MNLKLRFFLAILFILNYCKVLGQRYLQTFDVQAPGIVNFLNIDGNATAYYELYLTNFSTDTLKLKKLTILNIDDCSVQCIIQNQDLQQRFSRIGTIEQDTGVWLAPGISSVIYIEFSLPGKPITTITHLITFEVAGKENLGALNKQTATTTCISNTKLILSNPLAGGPWTAVYDPSWNRGHRKVIYTLNGNTRIPGRYAIDFIKMDNNGNYANGSENIVNNWLGYSVDVFAVADGIVSSTRDDFLESRTLSEQPEYTADMATGNYLSIKIGDNQFAFYEHLKPKSIKVKIGQKVKKGELIASLGYTGQTTGPHLHFHVADQDSPLGAEGIPFEFETFEILGSYSDFATFGKSLWTGFKDSKKKIRNKERPSSNSVIMFSEAIPWTRKLKNKKK